MTKAKQNIPTYGLKSFSHPQYATRQFHVELFDANRHFQVSYPHRHDFFEVLFLTKGSGFHVIDSSEYKIEPPCVFYMSPGQAHKLELSNDIEGYIFIFAAEFYLFDKSNQNRLLEFPFFFTIQQDNPPLQLIDDKQCKFLQVLFEEGIKELNKKEEINTELLRSILDTILNYTSTLYPKEEILTIGKGHILVKRFLQLVEKNFKDNLPIKIYADLLAVTPNHLIQTVKLLTGNTPNEIVKSKILLEAKRLLIHTNLGIAEISDQLNFSDQSYFTKFFKKVTNKTPLKYRLEYII